MNVVRANLERAKRASVTSLWLALLLLLSWSVASPNGQASQPFTDIERETPPLSAAAAPPSTGLNPALQSSGTPFQQRRFRLSLAENDVFFSDKGLSQFAELLYTHPLDDTLVLNTSVKLEMVTPAQQMYPSAEGAERCCVSPGIYHYPLYLESQLVRLAPAFSGLNLRLAGHVRAGIDAPEEIGGPLQNTWHDLIGSPRFNVTGDAEFYGGFGGSALLEGSTGALSIFFGPAVNFTTLQRGVGVTGGIHYDVSPVSLQLFATAERVNSRYFTGDFEIGRRVIPGVSASLDLASLGLGSRAPTLGFKILYDHNTVAPNLSNVRYTFIPDIQLSIPTQ